MRPLEGVKVIELSGLAPAPFCGMILADFGADVTVIGRPSHREAEIPNAMSRNPFERGKRLIKLDLKTDAGIEILKRMIRQSDVLLEPFRPGVMEGLGVGPDDALALNPGLIYARLTGWGQEGPYARMAGHDINYIGLSGALSLFRRKGEKPLPPCNLLGDFAGGGLLCALGILLALIERGRSGEGQIIDSAMLDGTTYLLTLFYGLLANGLMGLEIGTNLLDGGAPFYQVYETADGKFMAVGALEKHFYEKLLKELGLDPATLPPQNDPAFWPETRDLFEKLFKEKTREEWTAVFEGKDACVTPVLELDEVNLHPQNKGRRLLSYANGYLQPSPAPKLSRTPGEIRERRNSGDPREILLGLGYRDETIKDFYSRGIIQ